MTTGSTFYHFRRRTAQALLATLTFAIFAFGGVDVEFYSVILAAVLLALLVWTLRKISRPFAIVSTPLYIPLGLMVMAAVCQVALGSSAAPYSTAGALLDWLLYAAFFFLAVNTLADASIRSWFLQLFMAAVSVAVLVGIAQWLTVPGTVYWFRETPGVRPFGTFASADHFIVLVELAFPVALTLALRKTTYKLLYFLACAIMTAALIGAESEVGLAVIGVQFVFLTVTISTVSFRSAARSRRRGPIFVYGLAGAMALAGFLVLASWTMGVLRIGSAELEAAALVVERSQPGLTPDEVLDASWRLIKEKPFLGHGLGAFGQVLARTASTQEGPYWSHAQSDPVELIVEAGALAFMAQGLVLVILLWRARNLNVWGFVITPLAGAWAHSWFSAPIQTPAVMLAGLALLACTPGMTERVAVKRARARKADDGSGRVEKPRGYYASRTKFDE